MVMDDLAGAGLAAGAIFLVLVQLGSKVCTFGLNQALIRLVSPSILGISSYLEFIVSTILFIGREAARLLVQRTRTSPDSSNSLQSVVNFGYIPGCIGVPLALIIFYWKPSTFLTALPHSSHSAYIVLACFLSVCLEFACEPIYELNQFQLNFKLRSQLEASAIFLRCIVTFGAVFLVKSYVLSSFDAAHFEGLAVLSYALGQLAYSLTIFTGYVVNFYRNTDLSLHLRRVVIGGQVPQYFDSHVFKLWKSLFVQMVFKQLLTQGDILLMSYLCSVEEQGVYAVVGNYGSMVARLVFQPIEESVRLSFTKLVCNASASSPKDKANVSETLRVTKLLTKFYWNLSILLVLGGCFNASFLLRIILGSRGVARWNATNIFDIFPQYVLYLPFLAFNGIYEALFSSYASSSAIKRFSAYMTFLTCLVLVTLYVLIGRMQLSLTGLIISNVLNMALRIVYCGLSIISYYAAHGHDIAVSRICAAAAPSLMCGIAFGTVQYKYVLSGGFTQNYHDLCKSLVVCVGCFLTMIWLERLTIREALEKPKGD